MLKSEDESAESHIGLDGDRMAGCMIPVEAKDPFEDNQLADVPVRKESSVDQYEMGLEPYEGMEFESEEAARVFYLAYARRLGFRIRISKYSRSRRDNSVISRQIVCSKEGFREVRPKQGLFTERKQRQRAVTRVGCKAMIMVKKLSNGRWIVSKFVKEHNHGPVPPRNLELRVMRDVDAIVERPIASEGGYSIHEPFEGMEFDSEEVAKSFYSVYARHMGFRVRISKYCRSRRDNSIISRQLVCSKEGFREIRVKKETCDEGKIKRSRAITRIGCKAMIIVKRLNSGKWVVSKFEKEHNHALLTSKNVLHFQSQNCDKKSCASMLQGSMEVPSGLITDECNARVQSTFKDSLNILYTQLCHEAIRYAQEGATSEESYNVAMAALKEAFEKVASAKKNGVVAAKLNNPVIGTSQVLSNGTIFEANMHDSTSSNELKQAVPAQEVVLLQQPVNFVLIPSGFMSDPANQSQPAELPFVIHASSSQNQKLPAVPGEQSAGDRSAISSLSSRRKRKLQATDGSKESGGTAQKSQKVGFASVGQVSLTQSNDSNLASPGHSKPQLIAIPAVPVALFMPVIGSLPASCSVATPVTPGNYAFVAAPIEAIPLSACPAEPGTLSPQPSSPTLSLADGKLQSAASLVTSSTQTKPYTGPNPQVHAAAIAAGARVVHPSAAASLIRAIEARIRSGGGSLVKSTFIDGAKPLTIKPPVTPACSIQTGPQQ